MALAMNFVWKCYHIRSFKKYQNSSLGHVTVLMMSSYLETVTEIIDFMNKSHFTDIITISMFEFVITMPIGKVILEKWISFFLNPSNLNMTENNIKWKWKHCFICTNCNLLSEPSDTYFSGSWVNFKETWIFLL